jgi:hypothetical protein
LASRCDFRGRSRRCQVVLKKRDRDNSFHELWSTVIDPNSRFVNRADPPKAGTVWTLFESGPPAQKVDILLISEGYTAAQMPKFRADAKRLVGRAVRGRAVQEPQERLQRSRAGAAVGAAGRQPSTRRLVPPHANLRRVQHLRSERYLLTLDNRAFRDAAASAPYEFIEILANEQQYGGGGIFNDQATTAVDTGFAEYVFVHEFGHHFAALADEYYTSDVAYETGADRSPEPWEPNITALKDPSRLKWRDLVEAGTPTPTPWDKAEYETHSRDTQAGGGRCWRRRCPKPKSMRSSASSWRGIRSSCRR